MYSYSIYVYEGWDHMCLVQRMYTSIQLKVWYVFRWQICFVWDHHSLFSWRCGGCDRREVAPKMTSYLATNARGSSTSTTPLTLWWAPSIPPFLSLLTFDCLLSLILWRKFSHDSIYTTLCQSNFCTEDILRPAQKICTCRESKHANKKESQKQIWTNVLTWASLLSLRRTHDLIGPNLISCCTFNNHYFLVGCISTLSGL